MNIEVLVSLLSGVTVLGAAISAAVVGLIKAYKKTKEEIDTLPRRIKRQSSVDSLIVERMERLKEVLNADRVQIYDFHNGGHYANGRSALKTSCTYEAVRASIAPKQHLLQNIPLSCIPKFIKKLLADGEINIPSLIDIKHDMPATYGLKKSMGIKSFYDVVLNNCKNEPIGFLAVQYVSNKHSVLSSKDKQDVIKLKLFIEQQLEQIINS